MTERADGLIYFASQKLLAAGPTGNRAQTNANPQPSYP